MRLTYSTSPILPSMRVLPLRRYQMVAGMDRYLFGHSNLLWSYLVASSVVRVMSHAVSQQSRLFFMGLPTQPPPEESPSAADAADAFRRWRLALPSRVSMICSSSAKVDTHQRMVTSQIISDACHFFSEVPLWLQHTDQYLFHLGCPCTCTKP